jgi:hypothetical protein
LNILFYRVTNQSTGRGTYFIPRAHVPTMGTGGRDIFSWDGFSLTTSDERYNDGSYSPPSSSTTTYNPAYHTNRVSEEPVFTIFDDLDKRTPLSKGSIPRTQIAGMNGTLNSFPPDPMDNLTSTFLDSNDLNETELITDMLDDMTKYDNMPDDFIEALNPNLVIPRTTNQTEMTTSRRFSVCLFKK